MFSFRHIESNRYHVAKKFFDLSCKGFPWRKRCSIITSSLPLPSTPLPLLNNISNEKVTSDILKINTSKNFPIGYEVPLEKYSHQHGRGKIIALSIQSSPSSPVSTQLTELRHSSPMRLVPSRRSHTPLPRVCDPKERRYEAALLHLSSYGGGLVPGDSLHLDIDVRGNGAILCILTQGGQRIYRPGERFRVPNGYDAQEKELISLNADSSSEDFIASRSKICKSSIQCVVEPGSTLLYLPDPTVPYHQSCFQESRKFICQHDDNSMGSIIAVDWYSCGRLFSTGIDVERWAFEYLSTRTELIVVEMGAPMQKIKPNLVESYVFDNKKSKSNTSSSRTPTSITFGENLNAMATLLLHGPSSLSVASRANILARALASVHTRVRTESSFKDKLSEFGTDEIENEEIRALLESLGGRVIFSISQVETNKERGNKKTFNQQTHMVRILAESNEDVYRVLNYCLKPCATFLGGLEPYLERIHSSRTVKIKSHVVAQSQHEIKARQGEDANPPAPNLRAIADRVIFGDENSHFDFSHDSWFRLCALSDSALPVGSFAHSFGVEAASQMELFINKRGAMVDELSEMPWFSGNDASSCSAKAIADYVYAVSCSNARFASPLILAGYSLLVPESRDAPLNIRQVHQTWYDIDAYVDTLLISNEPGRRASCDQGLGLLRIISSFSDSSFHHHSDSTDKISDLWELIRQSIDAKLSLPSSSNAPFHPAYGHAAPIYGLLSASLGIPPLDCCRVFAFGAARDSVSAAVRLNLLGPTAGLSILDGVGREAVDKGLQDGLLGMISESLMHERVVDKLVESRDFQRDKWLRSVASCAPVTDTVQPLHDILSLRLFKT